MIPALMIAILSYGTLADTYVDDFGAACLRFELGSHGVDVCLDGPDESGITTETTVLRFDDRAEVQ